MKTASILVIGSANADHVFVAPRLPAAGETLLGMAFSIFPGGKGANQAVAAGRLGAAVSFMGCVGEDADGSLLEASLAAAGVETRFLRRVSVATGAAGIFVGESGRNAIVAVPGANALVSPADVSAALDAVRPSLVLCQLEVPMSVVEAASLGPRFVLNPAPACPVPDSVLARCHAIVPNETELLALTGVAPSDEEKCRLGASRLLDKGVQNVIVTLGERGCQWVSASCSRLFPAPAVSAIDTTAAGDVFCGALVASLAEGQEMADAIEWANRAAALSTTRLGAQASAPTRAELDAFDPGRGSSPGYSP